MLNKIFWYLFLLAIVFSIHGAIVSDLMEKERLYRSWTHFFIIIISFYCFVYVYNHIKIEIEKGKSNVCKI